MVNDEILSGIESALVRGQSLKQAMTSFYNAGYEKAEIEEAARHHQRESVQATQTTFPKPISQTQLAPKSIEKPKKILVKTKPSETKQSIKTQVVKTKVPETKEQDKISKKPKEHFKKQMVFSYGDESKKETHELKKILKDTIKGLRKIKMPQETKIVYDKQAPKPPVIVQKVSSYGTQAPKPINKAVTFLLVFLLIFLLGSLVAVFFFKQELVDLFNRLNIN